MEYCKALNLRKEEEDQQFLDSMCYPFPTEMKWNNLTVISKLHKQPIDFMKVFV